jgi:hypothetical protein
MTSPHSFSSLNTYLNVCPHQYQHRYVLKMPFEGNEATRRGTAVHEAMEHRIGRGTKLPKEHAHYETFAVTFDKYEESAYTLRVEQQLAVDREGDLVDFFSPKAFFRGKLDLSLVSPDYEHAYILDWKTGRPWEAPLELQTGAVLLEAAHVNLKSIYGQFAWLREGKMGKIHNLTDTDKTWDKIVTASMQIAADTAAGHFEKRPGPLCGYCPVKKCEHNGLTPRYHWP